MPENWKNKQKTDAVELFYSILVAVGMVLIVVGVAMASPAAATILAGLFLVLIGGAGMKTDGGGGV